MGRNSDSDDDETFYYRYSTPSSTTSTTTTSTTTTSSHSTTAITRKRGSASGGAAGRSGGLAPSKSTVYVSNLDFNLTNSDLFTLFSTFGKVARVTVLKDRLTRRSRGVAFILFVSRDDAVSAARQMNNKVLNGRTVSASIAADNGRAPEFIRRRVYKDKSRCYECGEEGHLSYECPRNQFGPRERPPPPKKGRGENQNPQHRMRKVVEVEEERDSDGGGGGGGGGGDGDAFEDDNWASVVDSDADRRLLMREQEEEERRGKKKVKRVSYFSDESGEED